LIFFGLGGKPQFLKALILARLTLILAGCSNGISKSIHLTGWLIFWPGAKWKCIFLAGCTTRSKTQWKTLWLLVQCCAAVIHLPLATIKSLNLESTSILFSLRVRHIKDYMNFLPITQGRRIGNYGAD
jgi:hypothetical protein